MTSTPYPGTAQAGPRAGARPGILDRLLNLFADVRAGEAATALLLMLTVFLLLGGYYLLKTIREPLILAAGEKGAEYKSYANGAIAGLLIFVVPLYSAVASRVSRVKLINGVTLFFIACLVAFFAWARAVGVSGAKEAAEMVAVTPGRLWLGIAFFIWVGIFNVMIIAQAWAFANDVYTVEQGKRLFAIVALGASLGAILGAFAAKRLIEAYGLYPLMLIAAVVLVLTMVLTNIVHHREKHGGLGAPRTPGDAGAARGEPAAPDRTRQAGEGLKGKGGFSLVLSDRYLLLIALLMMTLNLVNTTGEYILGERVSEFAKVMVAQGKATDPGKWIGSFYGDYFFWVNLISALLQAFVVSRVIKFLGVRGSLLLIPLVSLGGYLTLAFSPLLGLIRGVKTAENSLDYSLENTARQSLFLPTSREAKYKAKQATDTFFWRFGDLLSAGLVFAGTTWLGFATRQFALTNALFVVVWFVIAFLLGKRFQQLAHTK